MNVWLKWNISLGNYTKYMISVHVMCKFFARWWELNKCFHSFFEHIFKLVYNISSLPSVLLQTDVKMVLNGYWTFLMVGVWLRNCQSTCGPPGRLAISWTSNWIWDLFPIPLGTWSFLSIWINDQLYRLKYHYPILQVTDKPWSALVVGIYIKGCVGM